MFLFDIQLRPACDFPQCWAESQSSCQEIAANLRAKIPQVHSSIAKSYMPADSKHGPADLFASTRKTLEPIPHCACRIANADERQVWVNAVRNGPTLIGWHQYQVVIPQVHSSIGISYMSYPCHTFAIQHFNLSSRPKILCLVDLLIVAHGPGTQVGNWSQETQWNDTVDGRNPAPVEVGSLSHYLQGFIHSKGGDRRISEPSTVLCNSSQGIWTCHLWASQASKLLPLMNF